MSREVVYKKGMVYRHKLGFKVLCISNTYHNSRDYALWQDFRTDNGALLILEVGSINVELEEEHE